MIIQQLNFKNKKRLNVRRESVSLGGGVNQILSYSLLAYVSFIFFCCFSINLMMMFLPSEQTDLMVHGGSFQQADTRQPTHPLLRYQSGSPSRCEHSHKMLRKKKDTGKSEVGIKVQRFVIMYFIHLSPVVLYFSSWPFYCKNTLLCIYLPYILLKLSKQSAPDLDSLKLLFTFTSGAPSTNTVIQTRAIYVVLLPLPINNLFELQKVSRGQFTGKVSAVGRLTRLKGRKKNLKYRASFVLEGSETTYKPL